MADFETKCEQHALEYIKIHLREGYFVNAYADKGTYYWEKVYKIHVYKVADAQQTEPMKTANYCDICKQDMCELCIADASNPYCVPSHYEIKQTEPSADTPQTDCETCRYGQDKHRYAHIPS